MLAFNNYKSAQKCSYPHKCSIPRAKTYIVCDSKMLMKKCLFQNAHYLNNITSVARRGAVSLES